MHDIEFLPSTASTTFIPIVEERVTVIRKLSYRWCSATFVAGMVIAWPLAHLRLL